MKNSKTKSSLRAVVVGVHPFVLAPTGICRTCGQPEVHELHGARTSATRKAQLEEANRKLQELAQSESADRYLPRIPRMIDALMGVPGVADDSVHQPAGNEQEPGPPLTVIKDEVAELVKLSYAIDAVKIMASWGDPVFSGHSDLDASTVSLALEPLTERFLRIAADIDQRVKGGAV